MSRAERLTGALAERELDALLVTDLVNVRYLTGYTGSNGLALVGPELRRFITDFRYVEQAAAEVARATRMDKKRLGEAVPFVLVEAPGTVTPGHGVDDHDLLLAVQELLT